jgi:hypothetical protein
MRQEFLEPARWLGFPHVEWADPVWTLDHWVWLVASVVIGVLVGLLGFSYARTVDVANERLNDGLIVMWNFVISTTLVWMATTAVAIAASLLLADIDSGAHAV